MEGGLSFYCAIQRVCAFLTLVYGGVFVELPRPSKENMASIHVNDVTFNLILVVFISGESGTLHFSVTRNSVPLLIYPTLYGFGCFLVVNPIAWTTFLDSSFSELSLSIIFLLIVQLL